MTQTHLIDGKSLAAITLSRLKTRIASLDYTPGLATILIGDDPASHIYVNHKIKACQALGIISERHLLPAHTTEQSLLQLIHDLNHNDQIDGILLQLPIAPHLSSSHLIQAIDPDKDVDGFHPLNVGKLTLGEPGLKPCTARACINILKEITADLSGLHAVVVGRSTIVGKPTSLLLMHENCTVTIAHSKTIGLDHFCRQADIIIAAAGRPNLIKGDWIKRGALVLDVGITRHGDQLIGDVDFNAALGIAAAITPVPGGVGPMTIACLMQNTLEASLMRRGLS